MKIIKVLAIPFFCLCLTAGGVFTGMQLEKRNSVVAVEKEETVDTIAVVNLDEGTRVEGNEVNYAAQVLKLSGKNLVTTGLTEAREGISNGRYAAFIIIPSTFSESVESINKEPVQAQLQYDINPKLSSAVREGIINDIHNFRTTLNSDVAYIYLSAVLKEFHEVQGAAETIMKRDKDELHTLETVSAKKLIQVMDFAQIAKVENVIEEMDMSANYAEYEKTIDDITAEYTTLVDNGKNEYADVKKESNEVKESSDQLMDYVRMADPLINEKEESTIKEGKEQLDTLIDAYNTKQEEQREKVNECILEAIENKKDEYQDYTDDQLRTILKYLQTSSDSHNESNMEKMQSYVDEELKKIQEENYSFIYNDLQEYINNQLRKSLEEVQMKAEDEVQAQLPEVRNAVKQAEQKHWREVVEHDNTKHTESLEAFVNNAVSRLAKIKGAEGEANAIAELKQYLESNSPKITSSIDAIEPATDNGITLSKLIFNDDTDLWDGIKVRLPLTEAHRPNLPYETLELKKAVPAASEMKDINKEIWIKLKSEGYGYTIDESKIQLPDMGKDDKSNQVMNIESLYTLSKQNIMDTVETKVVGAIQTENEREKKQIENLNNTLGTKMGLYESVLGSFDPFKYLSKPILEAGGSKLSANLQRVQSIVSQKGMEYRAFASEVNQVTDQHIHTIHNDINKAMEETASNVINQMESLKKSRAQMNKDNFDILNSFAGRLKFTRLGNQPFKEAYELMINPVRLMD